MSRSDVTMDAYQWAEAYRARSEEVLAPVRRHFSGSLTATILFIKGEPGPAERAGGQPFSGDDGDALGKSLERLGFPAAEAGFCVVRLADGDELSKRELLTAIETIDPIVVVTLDEPARESAASALGLAALPEYGIKTRARGYLVVAVDGFEASLATQEGKRASWAQLKAAARPGEPY